MKIGLLFTAYNMAEYVNDSLAPWIQAKRSKLSNCEFLISAVSVPFAEYKEFNIPEDDTVQILKHYHQNKEIDYLTTTPKYLSEAEARSMALYPLLDEKCDIIWIADGDEFPTQKEISRIIETIQLDKFISWFKLSYKNFVFNETTYLKEAFTPARIWRVKSNGYELYKFSFDNDLLFRNELTGSIVSDKELPSKTIPTTKAWIKHLTWMNNLKSKRKCLYQQSHFNGICGYRWDDGKGGLIFNEKYYSALGQSIPEICKENS